MLNANFLAYIFSEIPAFMRTNKETDMARTTRLVILIKNIYTFYVRKRFLVSAVPVRCIISTLPVVF